MSDKSNQKMKSNYELRRARSIHEDVSLLVVDNRSSFSYPTAKDIHLSFVDHCFVRCCTDLLQCMKYLKKTSRREYIIVVVLCFDKETIQATVSQLGQYEQIRAFFNLHQIRHTNDGTCETPMKNDKSCFHGDGIKHTKSFPEYESLVTEVQQFITDAKDKLKDVGLFTTCNSSEKALRDLGRELGSFVWTHTFRGEHLDCSHLLEINFFSTSRGYAS